MFFSSVFTVLPGNTGFYLMLLGFARFDWVRSGCYWVLPNFTGFYWVTLGFTGFYLVLLGFTGFYWVLPSLTGF